MNTIPPAAKTLEGQITAVLVALCSIAAGLDPSNFPPGWAGTIAGVSAIALVIQRYFITKKALEAGAVVAPSNILTTGALIHFDDSVTAGNLPANQTHGVYYVDGAYANEKEVRARLPKAQLLGIAVSPSTTGKGIQVIDCEVGDATPAQAEAWVAEQLKNGVFRPCVYANQDTWENQGLHDALEHYGGNIKRWVAAYPGTGADVPAGYDAHQYAGGMTAAVDQNVAIASFFDEAPAPAPAPKKKEKPKKNSGVAHFQGTLNLKTGKWTITHGGGTAKYGGSKSSKSATIIVTTGDGGGKWHINQNK